MMRVSTPLACRPGMCADMGTRIPWFRYTAKEIKRQIRSCIQRGAYWWEVAEWRDALWRAQRLQGQRLRGKDRRDRCIDPE